VTRALVGVLAVLTAGCLGQHSGAFHRCNSQSSAVCGYVVTQLDATGHHPGSVRLYVQVLKASNIPQRDRRGTLFLLGGGPGGSSTKAAGLDGAGTFLQQVFPGYDLVAYDDRGTGRSDPLACPGLVAAVTAPPAEGARLAAACGRRLGTRRVFYSTQANADDIDAVRRALGVDRVALFGSSYGTRHALAYALAYPARVSRLVLDSVVPVDSSESFRLPTIRAVPSALGALCAAGACRAVTSDPAGDFAKLANELERTPLVARVTAVKGKTRRVRIDGTRLLGMAIDTDLNRGIAAELPAAVAAALAGTPQPLERLAALEEIWATAIPINWATGTATICADSTFPWAPNTPVADRPRAFAAAVAALAPAATAPFGSWAVQIGNATACADWPVPSGSPGLKEGPLPNIPVLILAGERDMRTPVTNALTVTRQFPQSTLLVVRGSGHGALSSSCAARYVIAWLDDKYHGDCPRQSLALDPIGRFPGSRDGAADAFATATSTLLEAQAAGLVTLGVRRTLIGLDDGTLTPETLTPLLTQFKLNHYSDAPGVALTGSILYYHSSPTRWTGDVDVSGTRAVTGHLTFGGGRISGTLGGRHVSGPLGTR
jgi:pimeloyl-ACP methyl ester carboxylesterase